MGWLRAMLKVRAIRATLGRRAAPLVTGYRLSRLQTVLVLMEVAGQRYGMGIDAVSDMHPLHRVGHTANWRADDVSATVRLPGRSMRLGGGDLLLVDLRSRLGLPHVTASARHLVLLVVQSGGRQFGLVVDRVLDVVEIPSVKITLMLPQARGASIVEGEAVVDGEPIDLLTPERLLPLMAVTA